MPRTLALLLCAAFVVFLLRQNRKQAKAVSRALWIPTVWMLLVTIKPLSNWIDGDGSDADESLLNRVVLGGILCFGLLLLAKRCLGTKYKLDWHLLKANVWLVLLVAYALVSIAWSETEYVSLKRWAREELLPVVMACVVLTERDAREAVQAVLRRTIYILIPASLLLVKYFPQYGVVYGRWDGELMWIGVATQKNGLGRLCFIAIFFLVWTLIKRWRKREVAGGRYQPHAEVLLLAMAIWLLSGGGMSTYSATGVAALAAGLVMLLTLVFLRQGLLRPVTWAWVLVMVLVFAYGAVLPFVTAGGSLGNIFADVLGRDQTLTGRTSLWAVLVPLFERHPTIGYGFGAFWTPDVSALASGVKEAHNGYLSVLLDLGVVGLAFTAMFLLSVARKSQKALARDPDWGIFCLCFLLMTLVHNVSESSLESLERPLPATLLLLSCVVQARSYQKSDRAAPAVTTASKQSMTGRKPELHQNLARKSPGDRSYVRSGSGNQHSSIVSVHAEPARRFRP